MAEQLESSLSLLDSVTTVDAESIGCDADQSTFL
jgi:hypothetical protein